MKKKFKIILFAILGLILIASFILSLGSWQKFTKEDVDFYYLDWGDSNRGRKIDDWNEFCSECGPECELELHFKVKLPRVEKWNDFIYEREFHCVKIIDGVNYYDTEGVYFGILKDGFNSFERLDPREDHNVQICCGMETYNMVTGLGFATGLIEEEDFFYQECQTKTVESKC
jgi:hypothetical protein